MARTIKHCILSALILASFLPMGIVLADVGPKPSMDFQFIQQMAGTPLTITSGILFECNQADCQDVAPLKQLGPQGFSCETNHCSALAYGFSTYHRLQIVFSDGVTRESNIFTTAQFQSSYQVTIRQSDLLVKSKFSLNLFSPYLYVIICGACLISVAALVVVIVLLVRRSRKK